MTKIAELSALAAAIMLSGTVARAGTVIFSTGSPDGLMAMASRIGTGSNEIEAADDFILNQTMSVSSATFTGLLPPGASLATVAGVNVEIYRVFPLDSTSPPSPTVPTRANSPSDVAFATRDSAAGELTFSGSILGNLTALNSVLNGINPIPGQTTGGEGPVRGEEVQFTVNFTTPLNLAANHYFFVPQVQLTSGDFYWLSAPKPITGGTGPFSPDLQTWMRNTNLDPNWLRVGTDIVGGTTPPTFNGSFSLSADLVPVPAALWPGLGMLGLLGVGALGRRRWRRSV